MKNQAIFTPGPSALYFTVEDHLKEALKQNIPSISHRSSDFERIYQSAVENLKALLNVPDNYHIFFTASATEIWERLIENCVDFESFHLVNGEFGERFYRTSISLGREAHKLESLPGSCPLIKDLLIAESHELIGITHNETSTGAAQPLEDIYKIREGFPDQLIAVDITSSVPYVNLDLSKVDSAYFSVQKGFGLPAGLGVWLVNDRCLAKAEARMSRGKNIGSYHSLPNLVEKAKKFQTPETPNVLNIYLLSKVTEDMLRRGIQQIRQEIDYKASVLYHTLEESDSFKPFVQEKSFRSKTVLVAESVNPSSQVMDKLSQKGLQIAKGHGTFGELHIRIANFPTHSKEQVEMLADELKKL
jgi:phosphoserine aminotransferase